MMVLFGVNCLYIRRFVYGQNRTNSRTVEFSKKRISSFSYFFLYLSYYYNYLIINYL